MAVDIAVRTQVPRPPANRRQRNWERTLPEQGEAVAFVAWCEAQIGVEKYGYEWEHPAFENDCDCDFVSAAKAKRRQREE